MPLLRFARLRVLAAIASFFSVFILANALTAAAQTSVVTFHNDNYRTGWNSTETTLTPSNVTPAQFGLLATAAVDDQIDGQPLVVPGVNITAGSNQGIHDVVYVATENNTVYAIDADAGTLLLSQHLGSPVVNPLGCTNNAPNVGITSTGVIDLSSSTLYVMAYIQNSTGPSYYLHALDLGSLTDKVTAQLVAGSHTLSDGSTYAFNATYQRQRPALLEANSNVYAAFGSFCDFDGNLSRGWVLGWTPGTLAPLAANQLPDTQATDPDDFFLSSIWMSGDGPAADDSGNVVFVTANSDYSGTAYDGVTNIEESVIKVSSDLSTVVDLFTPTNWSTLDKNDTDFGSGGVMVLPDQPGKYPHLAVAAGKNGSMFFMNEDSLGGYSTTKNNVLGTYSIGGCWCGESYFVDPSDGAGRVVSSGGDQISVWKVVTSPTTKLSAVSHSPVISTGQRGGFFTSISSNGDSNPIIWALARPLSKSLDTIYLIAFNPEKGVNLAQLFKGSAGSWPWYGGDYNIPPTVANGKVYVGSYKQLQIFGLKATAKAKAKSSK